MTLTKADVQCEKLLTVAGRTELIYLFDINSKGPVAVSLHAAQCRIRYNVATVYKHLNISRGYVLIIVAAVNA